MTFRPDNRSLLAALVAVAVALPAVAAQGGSALEDARRALDAGDGILAEVAARKALDAGVPRGTVAPYLGEAELLQGQLEEARNWLGSEDFSDEEWEHGFHALAQLEIADDDLPAAQRAFERALEKGEGSALLWVDYGRLRYRAGQHHKALQAAEHALKIDPDEPRALEFRAQLIRDSQGLRASLPVFERALEQAPDDMRLLGEYAAALGELGRYADMLRTARRMVEIDDRHPRAYFLQAVVAARAGKDELARKLLWHTDGIYDAAPASLLLNGILELRAGNSALSVEKFDQLVRAQPENPTALALLCRALIANDEANEAAAQLRQTADRPDASPYVLTLMGRALEQMGDRKAAADYLDRAARPPRPGITALPVSKAGELAIFRYGDSADRGDVARPLLRQMLGNGDAAAARQLTASMSERYPDSLDIEMLHGDVALLTGDPGGALVQYRSAGKVRTSLPLVRRIASAQAAMGKPQAGTRLFADFLRQNPQSANAAILAGRLAIERKDWEQARGYLMRAASLGGGARDPYLLSDLAHVQLELGEAEAAVDTSRRAYAIQRANGEAASILALAMQNAGEAPNKAAVLLAKARQSSNATALARNP